MSRIATQPGAKNLTTATLSPLDIVGILTAGQPHAQATLEQLSEFFGIEIANSIYAYGADGEGGAVDLAALDRMLAALIAGLPSIPLWAMGPINVGLLIPGPASTDPMPYLQRIFTAFDHPDLRGATLVFSGVREWLFSSRPTTGLGPQGQYLTPPQRCTLEWQARWDFSAYPEGSANFIRREGSFGPTVAVSTDIVGGVTTTFSVPSGQGSQFQINQRVLIRATTGLDSLAVGAYTLVDAVATGFNANAEDLIVQSSTADTVTFLCAPEFNYPPGATPIIQMYLDEPEITCINPLVNGPGRTLSKNARDHFLFIGAARNFQIIGGQIDNFGGRAVRILSVMGGSIRDLQGNGTEYYGGAGSSSSLIAISDSTTDFTLQNITCNGTRTTFLHAGSGYMYGITKRVSWIDCSGAGSNQVYNTHNLSEQISFTRCHARGTAASAYDIRCRYVTIIGGILFNCFRAVILRLAPNNLVIDGMRGYYCGSGVYLEEDANPPWDYDPDNITVRNTEFHNTGGVASHGGLSFMYSNQRTGTYPVLGRLDLLNNYVSMITGNKPPYLVGGRWTAPQIKGNEAGAENGNTPSGSSIVISEATGGTSVDGPINPVLEGHVYSNGYGLPAVTGVVGNTVRYNNVEVGFTASGQLSFDVSDTIQGSQVQEVSSFNNTGATGLVTATLPGASATQGRRLAFYVTDPDGLNLQAVSDDTIRIGAGAPGAAAGSLRSTTVGAWAILTSVSSLSWNAQVDDPANWTLS